MKTYKHSRKAINELLKKALANRMNLKEESWDLFASDLYDIRHLLLSTISKEECKYCKFVLNGIVKINDDGKCIYCGKKVGLTKKQMENISTPKQSKPVLSVKCGRENSIYSEECGLCGFPQEFTSPPTQTTKHLDKLVVPKFEKIKELEGTDVGIADILDFEESAINQLIRNQKKLIDYLTLISLDKK